MENKQSNSRKPSTLKNTIETSKWLNSNKATQEILIKNIPPSLLVMTYSLEKKVIYEKKNIEKKI